MVNFLYSAVLTAAIFAFSTSMSMADIRVIDGDTFKINGKTIRIEGIDAPEIGQRCRDFSGSWQCGDAASNTLKQIVSQGRVTCKVHFKDDYGRNIATCANRKGDIGKQMVLAGMAWAFVKYSDAYIAEERTARSNGIGIWQASTEPAWEFRSRKWASASNQSPNGCPIKGNISQNGKIYHPPWSPWYSRTRINTSKGERWFCSEAEAIRAGWRAPRG